MVGWDVLEYYGRGGEERRLAAGRGRWEFLRTWDILGRILPSSPGRILDVGGATGAYAEPLAEAGYDVCVIDPVPAHATAAAAKPGVSGLIGDARSLPIPDSIADAVLMFGPLYHLPRTADRAAAWREAVRVTRPGGVVAAAVIGRYAGLFDGIVKGYFAHPAFVELVDGSLADGEHRNQGNLLPWFTHAYFHEPGEAGAEAVAAGLTEVRTFAVEGPVWTPDEMLADARQTGIALRMLRRIEEDPTISGASNHLLITGRVSAT